MPATPALQPGSAFAKEIQRTIGAPLSPTPAWRGRVGLCCRGTRASTGPLAARLRIPGGQPARFSGSIARTRVAHLEAKNDADPSSPQRPQELVYHGPAGSHTVLGQQICYVLAGGAFVSHGENVMAPWDEVLKASPAAR